MVPRVLTNVYFWATNKINNILEALKMYKFSLWMYKFWKGWKGGAKIKNKEDNL